MRLTRGQIAVLIAGALLAYYLLRVSNAPRSRKPNAEANADAAEEDAFNQEAAQYGPGAEQLLTPTLPVSGMNIPRYTSPSGTGGGGGGRGPMDNHERTELHVAVFNGAWQLDNQTHENHMLDTIAERANVILGVETYDMPVGDLLPKGWNVNQPFGSDNGRANAIVATHGMRTIRSGYRAVPHFAGVKLRPRFIRWQIEKMPDGRFARVAAYHRAPGRYKWTWPITDRVLIAWIRSSKLPTIVGMDGNAEHLTTITRATGYRWVHNGIMGALVSPQWEITERWDDHFAASDHDVLGFSARLRRN